MTVTLRGISDETAKRTASTLKSKSSLIKKSIQTDAEIECSHENRALTLPFFPATLNVDCISAYIMFSVKLAEFTGKLNRASSRVKPHDNEKYAMRCFLLRLGFIGDESKSARKTLLNHLSGDAAFKSSVRPQRNCALCTDS
jgi:hypothetical protein